MAMMSPKFNPLLTLGPKDHLINSWSCHHTSRTPHCMTSFFNVPQPQAISNINITFLEHRLHPPTLKKCYSVSNKKWRKKFFIIIYWNKYKLTVLRLQVQHTFLLSLIMHNFTTCFAPEKNNEIDYNKMYKMPTVWIHV